MSLSVIANALYRAPQVGDSGPVVVSAISDFAQEMLGVLPIVLPVVITVLALRKGISFLMGTLRGA